MINIKEIEFSESQNLFELLERNRGVIQRYLPVTNAATKTRRMTKTYLRGKLRERSAKEHYLLGSYYKGELIGVIFVKELNWRIPKCELGYFMDQAEQGKGLMTHAICKTIDFCFDSLKMHKIILRIDPNNIGSVRVAEKCGFEKEGLHESEFRLETGELADIAYYGLIKTQ